MAKRSNPRKEEVQEMAKMLKEMSDEQKEALIGDFDILKASNREPYSKFNTLLLIQQMQKREKVYTLLAGYKEWLRLGYKVMKEEKGNYIYKPITGRKKHNADKIEDKTKQREMYGCYLAPVWDISQVEKVEESDDE